MTRHVFKPSQLIVAMGLTSTLLLTSGYAVAEQNHAHTPVSSVAVQKGADHRAEVAAMTQALVAEHRDWAQNKASDKARGLNNLVAKAQERREMMAELARENPDAALRGAVPADVRAALPAELQNEVEQALELEGTLEVYYQDNIDGSHKLRHVLATRFGERFELHFAGKGVGKKFLSGEEVSVSGLLIAAPEASDGDMVIPEGEENLISLALDGTTTVTSSGATAAALPNTFGEQKTAVILANFQDNPTQPWTVASVQTQVFGEANNFIRENSSQQAWLSGDVFGWFTLPMNSTSCNDAELVTAFEAMAKARGINLSNYNRYVFAFPYTSSCSWGGLGSVGGWPSKTLINGRLDSWNTVAHELGHNLGLWHAHSKDCGTTVDGTNCVVSEYGDTTDLMGRNKVHFSPFQKERLGWLSVTPVTTAGKYSLETYAAPQGSLPKALKVLKGVNSTTGRNEWFYLSLRQSSGFDSNVSWYENLQQGVVFQRAEEGYGNSSYLLDMTPNSYSNTLSDFTDPALTSGKRYTDPASGITFDTLSVTTGRADVYIGTGAAPSCVPANPAVSVSPATQWAAAGQVKSYTVTVTSKDSSGCSSRSYSMSSTKPTGWTAAFANSSLSLAAGASASTNVAVTSASTAANGYYDLKVSAVSGANTGSVNLTYVVDNPVVTVNRAPVAVNDNVTLSSKNTVTINVLANDYDPDGDNLKVVSATTGAKGTVKVNSNGTVTYSPAKSFKSTDSFSYVVSDGAKTATATVSIQLASDGSDSVDGDSVVTRGKSGKVK